MTYKVFTDDFNTTQEMRLYRNADNRCYISCGDFEADYHNGFITLVPEDIAELIAELQSIKKQIEDNG